jgi:hypothetical protein
MRSDLLRAFVFGLLFCTLLASGYCSSRMRLRTSRARVRSTRKHTAREF